MIRVLNVCSYGVHLHLFLQIGYRFRTFLHLVFKKLFRALFELIDDIVNNMEEVGIHCTILRVLILFNVFQLTFNLLFSDLNHQILEVVAFETLTLISTLRDSRSHEIDNSTVAL